MAKKFLNETDRNTIGARILAQSQQHRFFQNEDDDVVTSGTRDGEPQQTYHQVGTNIIWTSELEEAGGGHVWVLAGDWDGAETLKIDSVGDIDQVDAFVAGAVTHIEDLIGKSTGDRTSRKMFV